MPRNEQELPERSGPGRSVRAIVRGQNRRVPRLAKSRWLEPSFFDRSEHSSGTEVQQLGGSRCHAKWLSLHLLSRSLPGGQRRCPGWFRRCPLVSHSVSDAGPDLLGVVDSTTESKRTDASLVLFSYLVGVRLGHRSGTCLAQGRVISADLAHMLTG